MAQKPSSSEEKEKPKPRQRFARRISVFLGVLAALIVINVVYISILMKITGHFFKPRHQHSITSS
ncbi:UNVERIFIED_CONTAM: hypothetical protein HDU68_001302, partial [Siphonaria sp. JEL0065]